MKVPPHNNSIVCAIHPQDIARHSVLAAVLILCGAASIQSAPAAPPLFLSSAVEIFHGTEQGKTYSLEESSDLRVWKTIAEPFFGDGKTTGDLIAADSGDHFYRLKVATFPAGGKSRWEMSGCRMILNTADGVCRMAFDENATGTMVRDSGATAFTWTWKRDGLDTGVAIITWPDQIVETMTMQFKGLNAGVFSSVKTRDGLPAGAVSGTFRDASDRGFDPEMPAVLDNALIAFSGAGRAVGVRVGADGNAGISSPAGAASYTCAYTITGPATADLNLTCTNGSTEAWSLTFTGPSCGTCSWSSARNGVPRRASTGSFTIAPR